MLVWRREIGGQVVAGAVKRAVRERLYRRLLELGPGYTTGTRTGQAQSTIVDAVESLEKYYSRFLPQFAVTLIGATVLSAYVSPSMRLSALSSPAARCSCSSR